VRPASSSSPPCSTARATRCAWIGRKSSDPVVTVIPFKEVDEELIRRANDTVWAAGLRNNNKRAHGIADQLRAGTVWVNCHNIFDASMPFGGYKQSGWGREIGGEGLQELP
jgi:phenylacetaldehyde dehydrogenase